MYYEKEKDRIRTILCGTPLSAENIRMCEENLGKQWHGTSWFFIMHLIAKQFTKAEQITFDALYTTVRNYGVTGWFNRDYLRKRLETIVEVFRKQGITNIHMKEGGDLIIDGVISKPEVYQFADSQYQYSMGEGLIQYRGDPFHAYGRRTMSNYAERIFWHYITRVFDSPQPENELEGIYRDITETMQKSNLKVHDIEVWADSSPHILHLLNGWERALLSKRILAYFQLGDMRFVAPAFFSEIDWRPITSGGRFSGERQELLLDMISKLRKTPAWPVHKGNQDSYDLAKGLQRAGAVKLVEESKGHNIPPYVYLVSRDVFEDLDRRIKYRYSNQPFKEFGDSSLTELIFRMLGRARLYGDKVLPQVRISKIDYKQAIGDTIYELEQKWETKMNPEVNPSIFDPLTSFGVLNKEGDRLTVTPENQFIVSKLADYWGELVNDPTISQIVFPPKESVEKKEAGQIENQIKKSLKTYFS